MTDQVTIKKILFSFGLSCAGVKNTGLGHTGSFLPWNENPDVDLQKWNMANIWAKQMVTRWNDARKAVKCLNSK